MNIKTIPSNRSFCYVIGKNIHISYYYLTISSDKCLAATLYHELRHYQQFKSMVMLFITTGLLFVLGLCFLPLMLHPFLLLSLYLLLCCYCRIGEYSADRYALKHTDLESMKDFLTNGINPDRWYSYVFYIFRFHPSKCKRLKHIDKQSIVLPYIM